MNLPRSLFSLSLLVICFLLVTGCVSSTHGNSSPVTMNITPVSTVDITSVITKSVPIQTHDTQPANVTPWIRVEQIGDHQIGDIFTIDIETNLPVGTGLSIDTFPMSTNQSYFKYLGGIGPTYTVQKGLSGNNSYIYNLDTENFQPGQNVLSVKAYFSDISSSLHFGTVSTVKRFNLSSASMETDNSTIRTGNLKWKYKTDNSIVSSPTAFNGIVYFGSLDRNLYALDAETGSLKWKYPANVAGSSPKVANGVVFVGAFNDLLALDAGAGKLKWKYTAGDLVSGSPFISENVVYFGSYDNRVYALDATNGFKKWTFLTQYDVSVTPAVANGTVYVNDDESHFFAINATTGLLIWNTLLGGFSSPIIADGVLYAGDFSGRINAVDPSSGKLLWSSSPVMGSIGTSPAYSNGLVFAGDYKGKVFAVNATDGKMVWVYRTKGSVLSSPTVADGTLYVGSGDNKIYALNASTGKPIWTYTTGNFVHSSPVVYNGIVYVGSDDNYLYALEK
jgi:outer membrane protein assembly factor BamB